MQSPLPDSSALEAGIIEDSRPTRLSRVQDNVRNLLRNSLSHRTTIILPSPSQARANMDEGYESSTNSPITPRYPPVHQRPEVLSSPTNFLPATTYAPREMLPTPPPSPPRPYVLNSRDELPSPVSTDDGEGSTPTSQTGLLPSPLQFTAYRPRSLYHPDLDIAALAPFQQQKQEAASRAPRAAREARHRGSGKKGVEKQRAQRKRQARMVASQRCLCVAAGLLLAAVVATYLSLAITATSPLTATFHILFVLGVLLATIVFAHTLVRMCLLHRGLAGSTQFFIVRQQGKQGAVGRRRGHGSRSAHSRRQYHDIESSRPVAQQQRRGEIDRHYQASADHGAARSMNTEFAPRASAEYLPPIPIQVHVASDEPAPRQPPPTDHVEDSSAATQDAWGRPVPEVANPPPAYGRWRGSVRANPDLLHWHPIPSPVTPGSDHVLPSPTYEEAIAVDNDSAIGTRTGPPSYATKDMNGTPERLRNGDLAQAQVEGRMPEMVEIAGVGMAV